MSRNVGTKGKTCPFTDNCLPLIVIAFIQCKLADCVLKRGFAYCPIDSIHQPMKSNYIHTVQIDISFFVMASESLLFPLTTNNPITIISMIIDSIISDPISRILCGNLSGRCLQLTIIIRYVICILPFCKKLLLCGLRFFLSSAEQFQRCFWN